MLREMVEMSDTKKPRLSEIRAFQQTCRVSTMDEAFRFDNCAYLLDLVARMEKVLEPWAALTVYNVGIVGSPKPTAKSDWKADIKGEWIDKARALLAEVRE